MHVSIMRSIMQDINTSQTKSTLNVIDQNPTQLQGNPIKLKQLKPIELIVNSSSTIHDYIILPRTQFTITSDSAQAHNLFILQIQYRKEYVKNIQIMYIRSRLQQTSYLPIQMYTKFSKSSGRGRTIYIGVKD